MFFDSTHGMDLKLCAVMTFRRKARVRGRHPHEGSTKEAPGDTLAGGLESTPVYHDFKILGSALYALSDSTAGNLLDEGGCELRLDPLAPGRVWLSNTGSGTVESRIGSDGCQDPTSIMVEPGVPSRWWLSWKVAGKNCIVNVSKVDCRKSRGSER